MKSCNEFQELISAQLDGELSDAESAALTEHLAGCAGCRRCYAALSALSAALGEETAAPEGFAENVMAALPIGKKSGFFWPARRGSELTAAFAAPESFAGDPAVEPPARRRNVLSLPTRRWIGLAAALALVAGLGLFATRRGAKSAAPEQQSYAAATAADSAEAEAVCEESAEEPRLFMAAPPEAADTAAGASQENGEQDGILTGESNSGSTGDAVRYAAIDYALAYAKELTGYDESVYTDPDNPRVEPVASEESGYLPCAGDYTPSGECYRVIFDTQQDSALGPVVLLVDETGTVYGMLPRK